MTSRDNIDDAQAVLEQLRARVAELAAETARLREELEAVTRAKLWELQPLNMYEGSMRERACGDGRVSSREVLYALGYSAQSRIERDAALAREAALTAEVERLGKELDAAAERDESDVLRGERDRCERDWWKALEERRSRLPRGRRGEGE